MAGLFGGPFVVVLAAYAIWTLVSGVDGMNPGAIATDFVMILMFAGVPGMLSAYTYGFYLQSLKPIEDFETTLDEFSEELRKFRELTGGDGEVALSSHGTVRPLKLRAISAANLTHTADGAHASTLVIAA